MTDPAGRRRIVAPSLDRDDIRYAIGKVLLLLTATPARWAEGRLTLSYDGGR